MRIFTLLFLLLLLKVGSAFARKGYYEAGFIIQNNDTTSGFIERNPEAQLSVSIKFKPNQTQQEFVEYMPQEISGFGFNKDKIWFEAVEVEIHTVTGLTKVKRFAKVLLTGHTSLFKLPLLHTEYNSILTKDNDHVYVLKKELKYYPLEQHEFVVDNAVGVNKRYIGTLTFLFQDCPAVIKDISSLNFSDGPIIKLVQEYNACAGPQVQTNNYTYNVKPVVRHGIELSSSYFPFGSHNERGYSVGYFIDAFEPDFSKRISAYVGLSYSYEKNGISNSLNDPNNAFYAVRIPVALQVNIGSSPEATFLPFFSVGATSFLYFAPDRSFNMLNVISLGAGTYMNRIKFACYAGLLNPSYINLTLGLRLDRINK